jgi:surface polysaccharide O-acyltransferase-like enzyme
MPKTGWPEVAEPALPVPGHSTPAASQPASSKSRLASVDALRLIAILGVICIHTHPFTANRLVGYSKNWELLGEGISYLCRFAVPFFFCISGYFWGTKIRNGQNIGAVSRSMALRVAKIYVFWSVVYWLENRIELLCKPWAPWALRNVQEIPLARLRHPEFLLGGAGVYHLWFLPALLCSIAIAWLFLAFKHERLLIAFSIALFFLAVLARPYSESTIGISPWIAGHHIEMRDGPFFGTLFFVTGYLLSGCQRRSQWFRLGLLLFTAGLLLSAIEIHAIHVLLHAPPVPDYYQDFVFATYAMGIGATLISLAPGPNSMGSKATRLGRFTLGIYCAHLLFVDLLATGMESLNSPIAEVAYPILVFLLTIPFVILLSKSALTRSFVQ